MSKPNVTKTFKDVKYTLGKRSPEILTGFGIAGMITTSVLAVKATPKALRIIRNEEFEREADLQWTDKVRVTWKCYIPAASLCLASTACLIGASSVNFRRNAALATAYKLTETSFSEYKEKVVETMGDKKERAMKEEMAKDKLDRHPVETSEVIVTGKGKTLCYDGLFGRYFESDMDTIKRAITKVNRDIVTDMYASLNSFYSEIGLEETLIGDIIGWKLDDGEIRVDFSSQLATDGRPCLVVEYSVEPKYNYSKFVY